MLTVARRGERLRALADEVDARGRRVERAPCRSLDRRRDRGLWREPPSSTSSCSSTTPASRPPVLSPSASPERERGAVRPQRQAILLLHSRSLPRLARQRSGPRRRRRLAKSPFSRCRISRRMCGEQGLCARLLGSARGGAAGDDDILVDQVAGGWVKLLELSEVAGSSQPERRLPHLEPQRIVESALRAPQSRARASRSKATYAASSRSPGGSRREPPYAG